MSRPFEPPAVGAGDAPPGVAHVVVGLPIPRVWSYAIPPSLAGSLAPGQRVRVPFRGKGRVGVIVGLASDPPDGLEPLAAALDPVPALTAPLLALTRWAAEETVTAWGEAVARALPPSARAGAPATVAPDRPPAPAAPVVLGVGAERPRLVDEAAAAALARNQAVLVLVPEIEIAREWAERLARLGEPVSLVTSAESPRRRWQAWWRAREGAARIVVGTRVAAFVPVNPLGLAVVVDEEDPVHKALDAPRWHARELAIHRVRLEGGACLLTSAAPSLESWARVEAGEATARDAPGPAWPTIHRVDLRTADPTQALSAGVREAARAALGAGRSVLLLLNRLGYGRVLACPDCGAVRRCPHCRLSLTYHREARALACRLCGARSPARSLCPRCRGRRLVPAGWGTERVAAEARLAFPSVAVARYDSTVPVEAAALVRTAFRDGRVRVLVGTQMALRLAAEAPLGLAVLLSADATLYLPDFRAAERTFQTAWRLSEAVPADGSVWLQSFYPDHPALAAVAAGTREAFYEREWAERRELGYPPARRMARLLAEGAGAAPVAAELASAGRAAGLTVLGPAALPGGRVQVVLLGGPELPGAVSSLLTPLRGRRRRGGTRLTVDVDPVELP